MSEVTTLVIRQRVSWENVPFSELLFTVRDEDCARHYLTRVSYVVSNTAEQRDYELQQFHRRQERDRD